MSDQKKKISLDDIFNDDEFGLLQSKAKSSNIKSEEDRLIDSFEEINAFIDKHEREPGSGSMSEYGLAARLKTFRADEAKKKVLKPFDRHNLLGHVEIEKPSIDDILQEEDDLLNTEDDLTIFKYKNIPKQDERAEADFVAQREPMKEEEFKPYEELFHKVHQELKVGHRQLLPFRNIEKNLHIGNFYLIDGVMLYLESANLTEETVNLKSGPRKRLDGRTRTIFENGTMSNMLYRSLGKQIQKDGKLITNSYEGLNNKLFTNANVVGEEDVESGWVYVLKSRSDHPEIASIQNLYKIGFTSTPLEDRIRNARNEATYLYADVIKVASYKCYNSNANQLEKLLHRFFASACLSIDIEVEKGKRVSPREWFVVPFEEIDKAINLILNGQIVHYRYDKEASKVIMK